MNARPQASGSPKPSTPPRFDAKFIEDHQLIERYLTNKLPLKGARDLENWCREHPEYLSNLKLSERAQASLKLLEASGQPQDLTEPQQPWWKATYVLIGLAALTLLTLLAFWALIGKYILLRSQLEDTRVRMHQGSLVQPATSSNLRVSPDHAPGIGRARIAVNSAAPQLIDLHIDMSYTQKLMQFRLFVDKQDQGRVLVLNNVLKDSNDELRATINTTGISPGTYTVRIEALPPLAVPQKGGRPPLASSAVPIPIGWLTLEVQ
jgi:hypothetical protein